jgi:2-keto-3-deoxy-6-phosphogluconate aldolase
MTPSEINLGISLGCKLQKFFPAHINGGAKGLKAISEPFLNHNIKFCPTGGINLLNMSQYLSLENVFAVGGTWVATREQVRRKAWRDISLQARKARDQSARFF